MKDLSDKSDDRAAIYEAEEMIDRAERSLRLSPIRARKPGASSDVKLGGTIDIEVNAPYRRELKNDLPETSGRGGRATGGSGTFHKRSGPQDCNDALRMGLAKVRQNMMLVMVLTSATNLLLLAIPAYPFQVSDRVLTSRSVDTLIMLTLVIAGAIVF